MKTTVSLAVLAACIASTGFSVRTAHADAADAGSSATSLTEVVVTATKRTTSAQKTPIAMTVYSGEALADEGVHDLAGLSTIDPSVNLTKSAGAAYIAVRGIASTDLTEIGDPSVPIARDGFFVNRSFSIATSMYDLERVEVLKGPQGTVFGRNSTGGLVSIVTAKPSSQYGADASVTVGDYSQETVEGSVNLPVSDRLQLRVAGFDSAHDGYRNQLGINQKGDSEDERSARISAAVQPVDHLKANVTLQIDKVAGVGDVVDDQPLQSGSGKSVNFSVSQSENFVSYQPSWTNTHTVRGRWEFTYDALPFGASLYYGGGYDKASWDHFLDSSASASSLSQFVNHERPDTWNHEIRISSPDTGRLTYQFGYFYFNEVNNLNSYLVNRNGQFNNMDLIDFIYNVKTTSQAYFGTASYKLTDDLKVTVGARDTNDVKTRTGNAYLDLTVASGGFLATPFPGCYFGPPPPGGCSHLVNTTPGNGHIDETKPTYHLGLDWTWASNKLLYAKYDTGYKSGGFNSNGSAPSVAYGPETVDSIELGSKNRFLDNHLQVNADAFYQDYKGYQASQFTPALGGGPGIQNAGSAKISGVEFEVLYRSDVLGKISVNSTVMHTRFDDFIALDSTSTPHQIGGDKLPNAPELTANIAWEKDFDAFNGTLTPRADIKTSSSYFYSFFNTLDTEQGAYTTANAALTFSPHNAKWSIQAFVHNLTDEVVLANAQRNYNSNLNTYQFQPPRTYGVKLSAHF